MSPASSSTLSTREIFSYALPGDLRTAVLKSHREWDAANKSARLLEKDRAFWAQVENAGSLAWLDAAERQLQDLSRFKALSAEVREDGLTHVLLLSADGSGLSPAMFHRFAPRQNGCPDLLLLDSLDPSQVRSVRAKINPARTLFCVASRSANHATELLARYFFAETERLTGDAAAQHFLAIAGPDALSGELMRDVQFRHIYPGEPNLGSTYIAFSDFGLIPYSAAGHSVEKLLKGAQQTAGLLKSCNSQENPGVSLGLLLGTAGAEFSRNKVTLFCSPSVYGLGPWVAQLLAESTESEVSGLIPVFGEPNAESETYAPDRLFVYLRSAHDQDRDLDKNVSALEQNGQPVIRLVLEDLNDLGQLVFQWQVAAAVASSLLSVHSIGAPFRERKTERLQLERNDSDALFDGTPLVSQGELALFADPLNAAAITRTTETAGGLIRRHLDRLNPGDYFALLAYLPGFSEYAEILEEMRKKVLESKQAATLLGFGAAGSSDAAVTCLEGPDAGVILVVTCDDVNDLSIPNTPYTFGAAKAAQARSDMRRLTYRSRRALRIHLGPDVAKGLHQLQDLVCAAIEH